MTGDTDYTWELVSSPDDRARFVVSETVRWELP
jgi:lipocalin